MQPNGVNTNQESREKYWTELNDSEKIERIRQIIKQNDYLKERVYKLERHISKLLNMISKHTHDTKGNSVQYIETYFEENNLTTGVSLGKIKDEKESYF